MRRSMPRVMSGLASSCQALPLLRGPRTIGRNTGGPRRIGEPPCANVVIAARGLFSTQAAKKRGLFSTQAAAGQVFHGAGKPFELQEFKLPTVLGEGEVLVKLDTATICGSDLHTVHGRRNEPTPLILGHEGVGEVVAMGPPALESFGASALTGAPRLREGDVVTWSIADSCGHCPECKSHMLPQKCHTLMKYGHTAVASARSPSALSGTYATHILLQKGTRIAVLPQGLSMMAAAPANCALATVANSLEPARMPRYGTNNSAVVQGAGLLGIYAVAWLKYRLGMDHVFCIDRNAERLETAKLFGAIPLLDDPDGGLSDIERAFERRKKVENVVGRSGVDVVVEMTGVAQVLPEGVDLLRNGGHYAFAGMVHPDSVLTTLTGEQVIRKCLTIRGVHNYGPWHLHSAVEFLREFQDELPFDAVVDPNRYPLKELEKAMQVAASGKHCRVALDCQDV